MKRVNVGLSVQPIEDEMVEEIMVQGTLTSCLTKGQSEPPMG